MLQWILVPYSHNFLPTVNIYILQSVFISYRHCLYLVIIFYILLSLFFIFISHCQYLYLVPSMYAFPRPVSFKLIKNLLITRSVSFKPDNLYSIYILQSLCIFYSHYLYLTVTMYILQSLVISDSHYLYLIVIFISHSQHLYLIPSIYTSSRPLNFKGPKNLSITVSAGFEPDKDGSCSPQLSIWNSRFGIAPNGCQATQTGGADRWMDGGGHGDNFTKSLPPAHIYRYANAAATAHQRPTTHLHRRVAVFFL